MDYSLWKSNLGKLFMGGCGTQLGMLLTCGALALVFAFAFVCIFSNVIAVGITRQVAASAAPPQPEAVPAMASIEQTAPTPLPTIEAAIPVAPPAPASEPQELEMLVQLLEGMLGEIETLRSNEFVPPLPTPGPTAQPMLVASKSGVDLRSGPGPDYTRIAHLPIGQAIEIFGRNRDSTWWLVATPDGQFAWVSNDNVATFNVSDAVPVVTIPALLVHPASANAGISNEPSGPTGTPTPTINASRRYVEDMPAYKRLRGHLLIPPVSQSVSPDGSQIVITERIKVYTVSTAGADTRVWFEDGDTMGPTGGAIWSPDGRYIAFVVGFKTKYCKPCRAVAIINMAQETITLLEPPRPDLETDMPRWLQDGRLMINAHPGEPADGVAYVYDLFGNFEPASETYVLSSSHEGQQWYPWLPGRIWQAGVTERADSYNSD